jgi:hypothetical protein
VFLRLVKVQALLVTYRNVGGREKGRVLTENRAGKNRSEWDSGVLGYAARYE